MVTKLENTRRTLVRSWVVANVLGLGVGMAIFAAVAEGVEQSGVLGSGEAGEIVGHLLGLLIAGALFGYAQSHALGHRRARAAWAMLGSGAGLWLGYVAGYELIGFPFDYILGPALAATLAGAAHWPALRQRGGSAGWWLAANGFGFLVGSLPGLALAFLGLGEAIGGSYFGWMALNGLMALIAGLIGGAISGAALLRGRAAEASATGPAGGRPALR